MSDPVLSLRDVSLFFPDKPNLFSKNRGKGFWALRDINFDLFEGETLGIIGHNGSGKSTLLKIMAGVYETDTGTMKARPNLHIQLMAIGRGFESSLTGRENAVLNGLLLGKTAAFIRKQLDAIIEFSELGDFIDKPVYTYSSGMTARLGFAVAFHAQPDVILIDEVLGVGDESFRQKSKAAIRSMLKSNKTVVLISHDRKTMETMCDRAILLTKGKLVVVGQTSEVMHHYDTYLKDKKAGKKESPPAA
jgi:lipopolysaccharide transport system ATP-binding protein